MTELPSPIWILDSFDYKGLKVGRLIVELPYDAVLATLDAKGKFLPAIFKQVVGLIRVLKGEIVPGMLMEASMMDKPPVIDSDIDVSLIMFVKHYRGTSMTAACIHNEPSFDIPELQNSEFTNPKFKEANFLLKIPAIYICRDRTVSFGVVGEAVSDLDVSEVEHIRSKIY